jgi:MFS family permease
VDEHTPQDGARAWLAVAVAFAAMFVTFGVAYSFGAFLVPMSEDLGASRAATSAVFSLTTMALFALGAVSGPAVDRFGPRGVVLVGAAALGGGLWLTARADSVWQAYVGHGLGVGLAVACCYVPLIAVVGGWFERRRTLAVGVAVSGIGLGTLVGAPVAAALIGSVGWRAAYLTLAVVGVAVLLVCAALVRPAPVHVDAPSVPLRPRLRSGPYVRLYLAGLLLSVALFVPFVHLPAYAVARGTDPVAAAALVGVIGAASVVGRLALGGAAARLGVLTTYQGCFVLMAASFAVWLVAPGYALLVVFALLLGVGYGGFVALGPPLVAGMFGLQGLGGMLGVLYTSAALGSLVGPPLAGLLIAAADYAVTIAASLLLAAVATAVVLRVPAPAAR